MEKKILQWMSMCSVVLTVVLCSSLYHLPAIREQANFWEFLIGEETAVELEGIVTETEKEKLYIELPDGVDGKDITVTNDYLTQTIYIRFAQAVDGYSENYSVHGSSEHIANLSYYREGEEGVLAVRLDKVCEISYLYKEGNLCVTLIDPHEIYDRIIVVDAGHGGRMPGAVKRGILEKNINLEIVQQIKAVFDEMDDESLKVYYTRLDDTSLSLKERADLANYVDADMFISIHNNSSHSGFFNNEQGTLILYSADDEGELNSRRLAEICMENVQPAIDSVNLGFADGDDLYIIRNSNVPVVLIEVGYMTNSTELRNLTDPEYQRKVAEGVCAAVMQAYEEGY